MQTLSAGFIGAGRITRTMLEGFSRAGVTIDGTVFSGSSGEALQLIQKRFPGVRTALHDTSEVT